MANTLIVRDLNIKILILTSLNKKLCSQKVVVEKESENDYMHSEKKALSWLKKA
jgi:hypothetical protein